MPVIKRLPAVEVDLLEIWTYIAEDSVRRADHFVDRIDQVFHLLADRPYAGRARDELFPELRSFPIGNYVVFYCPLPGQKGIEVVRVLNASRDIPTAFSE